MFIWLWLSLVERCLGVAEVAGSNPASQTTLFNALLECSLRPFDEGIREEQSPTASGGMGDEDECW